MDLIDTHVHLWDLNNLTYAFLRETDPAEEAVLGNYDAIKKDYLIDDYLSDIEGCGISKAVHVQAALGHPRPIEETDWLQGIADRNGYPQAIIGHCDLREDDADETLEGHMAYRNFRGIRMLGTSGMLDDARFRGGFSRLQVRGLIYELEATVEDMPASLELARSFPDVPIVLTHTGLPLKRTDAYFAEWRDAMRSLATAENVICKISGLGMGDHTWTVETIRRWVEAAIEVFGVNRCMFGSNWPVDSLYSSYRAVIDAYREIVSRYGEDEQRQLFQTTAETIYRI
jgi:predicted TIM-barrel fold metal-dependent hydrolase